MLKREKHKNRPDLSLLGVALCSASIMVTYAMYEQGARNTGLIGKLICVPLFAMFADLASLVPIIIGLLGMILIFEASEPTVAVAMTLAANCYVLLFATLFHQGTVGKALAKISVLLFGEFNTAVVAGLFGILTFSMLGISSRRAVAQAGRLISQFLSRLWDIRLPNQNTLLLSKERAVSDRKTESYAPPIPLSGSIAAANETIIDATFVETPTREERRSYTDYRLPNISLFSEPVAFRGPIENKAQLIETTLASFNVSVKVTNKIVGASVTRYELLPHAGVTVDKIRQREKDLALALAAPSIVILTPIPGKSAVGIEIPNAKPSTVTIREILATVTVGDGSLTVALGKDVTGKAITADLRKMPHLLVAGATGAGKSVCLNNIIASLLVSSTPEQVQMLFIDPKRVELSIYRGIPHLHRPVVTDTRQAVGALQEMAREMDDRYKTFELAEVNTIEDYNVQFPNKNIPYIVIVIDELADLMATAGAAVEAVIIRLTQLARATGIHLVVATQRPTVDVITGLIKANIPSRISFAVASQVDSRTILDTNGAELLLGRGDMLFKPIDAMKATRLQGAFVTRDEIKRLVSFWSTQSPLIFPKADVFSRHDTPEMPEQNESAVDALTHAASRYVIGLGYASTAKLKEQFQLGHPRAARLMEQLEELGIVAPNEGKKPRRVLVSADKLDQVLAGKIMQCSTA